MENIVLHIDKMKYLESIGLDTLDASMMWVATESKHLQEECILEVMNRTFVNKYNYYFPAYTLQDILCKLPKKIYNNNREYKLEFVPGQNHFLGVYSDTSNGHIYFDWIINDNPLIVAFELLVWCTKNGYINTKLK